MGHVAGQLDLSADGGPVRPGATLTVRGWALFDGWPADEVEVFVGDAPARLARRNVARPELAERFGRRAPGAAGAGFAATVLVDRDQPAGPLEVRARALGREGMVWHSETVVLQVEPAPAQPDLTVASWQPGAHAAAGTGALRVCIFAHSLRMGGGELYLDELVHRLHGSHGLELLVVSPTWGPLGARLEQAGVPVLITHQYAVDEDHYEGRVAEFQALLASWQADVVLANTLGVFQPVDAALRSGLPAIWAIHESFELEHFIELNWGRLSPHAEARLRHCLVTAETVFVARATLELFARQLPALRGRHMPYGVDLEEITTYIADHPRAEARADLGYSPEDLLFLCMGIFQARKNQLGLVLAFAELAALHPHAQLALVGAKRSPYTRTVRRLVRRLGLEDRVRVVPIAEDTRPWYHAADALVSASDIESLPRSILEAKAFGVPTLATDVFGVSELITDGENGWLCRPGSGNALVAGLHRVLCATGEQRRAMAARCRQDARQFDGAQYARAYTALMHELAGLPEPLPTDTTAGSRVHA